MVKIIKQKRRTKFRTNKTCKKWKYNENVRNVTAYEYKWEYYDEIIVDNEEWRDIKPEIINGVKYLILEELKIIKEKIRLVIIIKKVDIYVYQCYLKNIIYIC